MDANHGAFAFAGTVLAFMALNSCAYPDHQWRCCSCCPVAARSSCCLCFAARPAWTTRCRYWAVPLWLNTLPCTGVRTVPLQRRHASCHDNGSTQVDAEQLAFAQQLPPPADSLARPKQPKRPRSVRRNAASLAPALEDVGQLPHLRPNKVCGRLPELPRGPRHHRHIVHARHCVRGACRHAALVRAQSCKRWYVKVSCIPAAVPLHKNAKPAMAKLHSTSLLTGCTRVAAGTG